jgi:hypothetical protein
MLPCPLVMLNSHVPSRTAFHIQHANVLSRNELRKDGGRNYLVIYQLPETGPCVTTLLNIPLVTSGTTTKYMGISFQMYLHCNCKYQK